MYVKYWPTASGKICPEDTSCTYFLFPGMECRTPALQRPKACTAVPPPNTKGYEALKGHEYAHSDPNMEVEDLIAHEVYGCS